MAASKAAGDAAWRMPLDEAYQEQLKSNFADMANIGTLNNVNNKFSNILCMITHTFNRFSDKKKIKARRDHLRVFCHIGNKLAHKTPKLFINLLIIIYNLSSCYSIKASKAI